MMRLKTIKVFVLILVTSFVLFNILHKPTLEDLAKNLISKCSSVTHRPSCYDIEIPKLMDPPRSLSLEDSFKLTKIIQEKDSKYRYCHVLGHSLATKEVKKDPTKWKEIITRCPDGVCDSGCMHGALAARFQKEYLNPAEIEQLKLELKDACERTDWNSTNSKRTCYHGLGHLLMYATAGDIDKTIEACSYFKFSRQCISGAFMQIFQLIDEDDKALVAGKVPSKEEIPSFCAKFGKEIQTECMIYAWSKFTAEVMKPEGLIKYCSFASDLEGLRRCQFKLIGFVTIRLFEKDPNIAPQIKAYCSSMPKFDDQDKRCFATAAKRMSRFDNSKVGEICDKATPEARDYCFNALLEDSKTLREGHSEEYINYCKSLSSPWKENCLEED